MRSESGIDVTSILLNLTTQCARQPVTRLAGDVGHNSAYEAMTEAFQAVLRKHQLNNHLEHDVVFYGRRMPL